MGLYFSSFLDDDIEFNKFGWIRDPPDHRDHIKILNNQSSLKEVDLRNNMPGIYDQKEIGSCVASAVAAAYEYNKIILDENHIFIPSKLFIYYNTRKIEKRINYDSGATIRNTIKSLNKYGVCCETKWNNDKSLFQHKPYDECYTSISLIKYYRICQNLDNIKYILEKEIPIIFGMSIYANFNVINNNILDIPDKTDKYIGGYCGLCVGFIQEKKLFIVRASFGVEWGDKGYFYMPYDYVLNKGLCSDFWIVEN